MLIGGFYRMIFMVKILKTFAANSTVRVSEQIAECLGLPLGKSEVSTFSDGEITVSFI